MKRNGRVLMLAAAIVLCLAGCQTNRHIRPDALVLVKDVRIPETEPKISHFARHSYIEYRENVDAEWKRVEIRTPRSGIEHGPVSREEVHKPGRFGRRVRVLSQFNGEKSARAAAEIRAMAARYDDAVYEPWPGPNSNTFIDAVLRDTDGVSAVLDHNAIGKDYGLRIGPTAGGTGIEIDLTYLGFAAGLKEGVELNLLGFTLGVGFWPPALKIPVLPELPGRPFLEGTAELDRSRNDGAISIR